MRHLKLVCLIGDPVEHSISPVIHNEVFKKLGLNYVYLAFRVAGNELEHAVRGLKALGAVGFNVTLPHKVAIIKYLDELSPEAKSIGSVNTVVNSGGKLVGYNTDVVGVTNTFKSLGVNLHGASVVVLGAGGASRAVLHALASNGSSRIYVINRTLEKAVELANEFSIKFPRTEFRPMSLTLSNLQTALEGSQILINTTSVGMYPKVDESLIPSELLRNDLTVFDVVYNPVETRLLRDAKSRGAKTIDGVHMLVHQAVASFRLWTGVEPPINFMFDVAYSSLRCDDFD